MEVQAYITLNQGGAGDFQFGLVAGGLDGEFVRGGDTERFEFTWEGNDECDEVSGSGWLRLKSADEVEGSIKLHGGRFSLREASPTLYLCRPKRLMVRSPPLEQRVCCPAQV